MVEIAKGYFPASYAKSELDASCTGFGPNGIVLPMGDASELCVIVPNKNFDFPRGRFADFGITGADELKQIETPKGYSQTRTYVIPFANFPEGMRQPLLILAEMETRIKKIEEDRKIKHPVVYANFDGEKFSFSSPVGGISRKTIAAALGIDDAQANNVVFGKDDYTRTVAASIVRTALGFPEPVIQSPSNSQVRAGNVQAPVPLFVSSPDRGDPRGQCGSFRVGHIPLPR